MASSAIAADPYADRRRRTDELLARYTFAREVLDFYGALLAVQEHAHEEAISASPGAPELVAYVAEMVVPAVVDVTVAAGPQRLREGVAGTFNSTDPRELVAAWVGAEEQKAVERFLARAAVGPVLEALGARVASSCVGTRDARHCPTCGGLPQLGYFALAGEDLAAGGRYLLCSRCGASWGYARMTCAACGESSSSRLPIFNELGSTSGERGSVVRGLEGRLGNRRGDNDVVFPHIRIEACETCRHYLLNIDVQSDPVAEPVVDELSALPLDLYARDKGFTKVIPNLMGF